MRIDNLYNDFNSLNITSQAGFYRPVKDFIPAVIEASIYSFNTLAKQQTKSQMVQDVLLPFKKSANISVEKIGNAYIAKYPKDYKYYESGGIITLDDKCYCDKDTPLWKGGECVMPDSIKQDFLPESDDYIRYPLSLTMANKWNALLSHPNRKPTFFDPHIVQRKEGFEVAPKDIGVVVIDYYRMPSNPVFNYTRIQNGPDVYLQFKEEGSLHLEWGDEMLPAFLYLLSKRFGYTVSDQLKIQVTAIDKSLL